MRLIRRIFGGEAPGGEGARSRSDCARFEKALLLSLSGDGRATRSLGSHLAGCADCRRSLALSTRLRERCLEVASDREGDLPSLWAEVAAGLEAVPVAPRALPAPAWGGRRRLVTAAALSAAAMIGVLCLLAPVFFEGLRGPDSNRTALDSPWSKEWDEFVSGSEPRGDLSLDPFAPEIPNPEVIDF